MTITWIEHKEETMVEFIEMPKMARLSREIIITEKIDGTNGCIYIGEDGEFLVGSRTRWLNAETGDNHGFLLWALTHKEELMKLGVGKHYGEWWGSGIQRGYGLVKGEKRFSLFNVSRWADDDVRPSCCYVVPEIVRGMFTSDLIFDALQDLRQRGSLASPGFMKPEGIVIFHTAQGNMFKKTFEKDEAGKGDQR
jgi:hypothetical protein